MRDLTEMAYEANTTTEGKKEYREKFTEMFMEELNRMKGEELAPHLSCAMDLLKMEYRVILSFPVILGEHNPVNGDIK